MRFAVPAFNPNMTDRCFCNSGRNFGECCGSRSPQRALPAGVQLFSGFLDKDTCKKWVKRFEKQPRVRARMANRNSASASAVKFVEDPARVCHNVKLGAMRVRVLDAIVRGYQRAVAGTGHELAWYEMPNILRYQPGGFYLSHSDSCIHEPADGNWYKILDRDLSLLIYLNDDFEGGGLTFMRFNFHLKPRAGDLLIFPSDNRYEHQAEKVESGIRYCIASWAALHGTRKVFQQPTEAAILFDNKPPA
jgi:predicted 2-oxoglutarate/Fe(II)-dependent dioxygenase YbiX